MRYSIKKSCKISYRLKELVLED